MAFEFTNIFKYLNKKKGEKDLSNVNPAKLAKSAIPVVNGTVVDNVITIDAPEITELYDGLEIFLKVDRSVKLIDAPVVRMNNFEDMELGGCSMNGYWNLADDSRLHISDFGVHKIRCVNMDMVVEGSFAWRLEDSRDIHANDLPKQKYISYVLLANHWGQTTEDGYACKFFYRLPSEYDNKIVEVYEDTLMTEEQLEVLENAKIKGNPSEDAHYLYAFGDKPTIDLPVILGVM